MADRTNRIQEVKIVKKIQISKHLLPILILSLVVGLYWIKLADPVKPQNPTYNFSEVEAISKVNLITMWSWLDYKSYKRYSPTGLLFVGLIDRHIISPLCGIDFSDVQESYKAQRLLFLFYLLFVCMALLTYWITWEYFSNVWASFLSGLFIGVNKTFYYFYYYVDTITLALMVIYGIFVLLFWKRYVENERTSYLWGYYIFFFFLVGSWEQWVNFLASLILYNIYILFRGKIRNWRIAIHGILIPLLIFSFYITLRLPTAIDEVTSVKEAQYVTSYPSKSLMLEDVIVNTSLHIADTIDSLLFPWPMLSQSILKNYNMDTFNPFNKKYAPYPSMHYRMLSDWYAGFLLCLFIGFTIQFAVYVWRHGHEGYGGIAGILLVWTGFLVHVPVMYRAYFSMPGYFLGYKHIFSILGFSILIGWMVTKCVPYVKTQLKLNILLVLVGIWIIYCNYGKISSGMVRAVYPW